MYLRILVTRLKNFGILNLYIMATMKANGCPPGQHKVNGICTDKPLSSIGARIGVGTVLAGAAGMVGTAIKNTIKRKKLEKAEEEKKKAAEEAKKMSMQQMGGATKKYMTGGMVNSNAKVTAAKVAKGTVGGKTKAISKEVVKSTSPKGKTGGVSKAPTKASPTKNKRK